MDTRKKRGISQEDPAEKVGTNSPAIRLYERGEMKPSIEAAAKITKCIDGQPSRENRYEDNAMLKRIKLVSTLPDKEKEHVFVFLDSSLEPIKLQGIL